MAVAAAVAERLARAARNGGHIALTGGTTPEQAYKEAARREPDWSNVEIWWSDERCVPPDDDLSNYALAKRTLLDLLERGPRAVHRIRGELGKEKAAADYELELGDTAFDLELLGIGKDGHTASLFPNAPTLRADQARAPGGARAGALRRPGHAEHPRSRTAPARSSSPSPGARRQRLCAGSLPRNQAPRRPPASFAR